MKDSFVRNATFTVDGVRTKWLQSTRAVHESDLRFDMQPPDLSPRDDAQSKRLLYTCRSLDSTLWRLESTTLTRSVTTQTENDESGRFSLEVMR